MLGGMKALHERDVGRPHVQAALREQGCDLSAVMGLMSEYVRDPYPAWDSLTRRGLRTSVMLGGEMRNLRSAPVNGRIDQQGECESYTPLWSEGVLLAIIQRWAG